MRSSLSSSAALAAILLLGACAPAVFHPRASGPRLASSDARDPVTRAEVIRPRIPPTRTVLKIAAAAAVIAAAVAMSGCATRAK
jgi:hypothetical protein